MAGMAETWEKVTMAVEHEVAVVVVSMDLVPRNNILTDKPGYLLMYIRRTQLDIKLYLLYGTTDML